MRARSRLLMPIAVLLAGYSPALAADWPDHLSPKQIFRIEISEAYRAGKEPVRNSGIGFAISPTLLLTTQSLVTEPSRFETPLTPNRSITISYAEGVAPGADIKSSSKFRVLSGAPEGLALLEIKSGLEQMELSVCKDTEGGLAFYSFRNGDLNEPVRVEIEPSVSKTVETRGVERFVLSSSNGTISDEDIGAPVIDGLGRVVGILTAVSAQNEAIATLTPNFVDAVPDDVKVACSDRYNSVDYVALDARVKTLLEQVATLQTDLKEQKEKHEDEVTALKKRISNLRGQLHMADIKSDTALNAIAEVQITRDEFELSSELEKKIAELQGILEPLGNEPIKPRLDQISKDLGDVNWTFRIIPDTDLETVTLTARYSRQLSDQPFSKIMALCVTPLKQTPNPADDPGKNNVENAVFYEERDKDLLSQGRTPRAKCKKNEHKDPLKQTKSGDYTFMFDAEFDEDWTGLAYVQFYKTLDPEDGEEIDTKAEIVRRMLIGVDLSRSELIEDGKLACFDFSKRNQRPVDAWDELALFLGKAPEERDEAYKCG